MTEILVCANGPGLLESRLKTALQVAHKFRSHIKVVFFREAANPLTVDAYAPGFNYSPQRDLAQSAWDTEVTEVTRAKAVYDRWMMPNDVVSVTSVGSAGLDTTGWSEVVGSVVDLLPSYARACDLIVAGGPGEDASSSILDDEVSRLALLSSGRMTLLAPRPGHLADDILRSVLIAWDDSAAISRTIAQAMQLVAAAKEVRLFIGETSPESVTPCHEFLSYLRRKDVQPSIVRSVPTLHTVRETLVQQARELDASLIIMGAYKHSRTQEVLLGGTTRHVIQHASCAVLMVH